MLQPGPGKFQQLQQIILDQIMVSEKIAPYYDFDPLNGWGHVIKASRGDVWRSLKSKIGTNWTWDGAKLDQGLLYFWVKYVERSASIINGKAVENWNLSPDGAVHRQVTYSALPPPLLFIPAQRNEWLWPAMVEIRANPKRKFTTRDCTLS